ncbi:MAG TPA: alpha-glucan family phosphorylase [Terriglobia bacterium]|nr:alpha-glucan family phosphorylase [Terriglobia bacterium]
MNPSQAQIAYFSMEIALEAAIPTYSGGLGILAGDMLRSAADLSLPMVGVSLLYRKGYFEQHLDAGGQQTESPQLWNPEEALEATDATANVSIEGRHVRVRAWRYRITGISRDEVPVYLLDTAMPENDPRDQALTDQLYGGDRRYRLCQEIILGVGGVRLLRALGYVNLESYHMNEGHSALLAMALFEHQLRERATKVEDLLAPEFLQGDFLQEIKRLRQKCIFTTHTPVPAGHDVFDRGLVSQVIGERRTEVMEAGGLMPNGLLNMTELALACSRYVNGVAMRHGEVSRSMFPRFAIRAITNGVHATTWTCPSFQQLYDQHVPEWRGDNRYLRYAMGIPIEEIRQAHAAAKRRLFDAVLQETGVTLDESKFTLGFARRAAVYKRADLLLSEPERLEAIARDIGPLQIIYAGKAHPADEEGKALIRRVFEYAAGLKDIVRLVYLQNYDMRWGQLVTAGVDLWLNTPLKPYEASGTSGMKAALNGVPSLSVLDGWWIEGHAEGVTGWSIGGDGLEDEAPSDIDSLYDKLGRVIAPLFYNTPLAYAEVMRGAIAFNGEFFNTQRMLHQYERNAYRTEAPSPANG